MLLSLIFVKQCSIHRSRAKYILWEEKKQINYKFIPTSLFRGCPLITMKQACRDELVVYLFFFSSHNNKYRYI